MDTGDKSAPDLILFRNPPAGWLERPPLPGSLQAFETSLIAVALGRYHTALVLCVSAIEAALKAHLRLPLPTVERPNVPDRYLPSLWEEVAARHPQVASFSRAQIEQLKNKRNRMAHYGHAPADNPACAELLLDVGYPLFTAVLADCFDFHLDWRALKPNAADLVTLSEEERKSCGFHPEVALNWRKTFEVRRHRQNLVPPAELCFLGLVHYIRRYIQPTFTSSVENAVWNDAEEHGHDLAHLERRLSQLERQFPNYWLTNCPFCGGLETLALDLEFPNTGFNVGVKRAMCVRCDLFVPESGPLGSILFAEALAADLAKIVEDYGLKE